jgi:hypothetical protein
VSYSNLRCGEVAEPGLRRTPGERVDSEGSRGFESPPLRRLALCRWLDPFLVVRLEFLEWTPENRLRHPRFAGLRNDKGAHEVAREDDRTMFPSVP